MTRLALPARAFLAGVVVLSLSGCAKAGEPIGGEAWLDYAGPDHDVVLACVKALPSTIESPRGYPGASEFTSVTVEIEPYNDAVDHFSVAGDLRLLYGAGDDLRYTWSCTASQRYTMIDVTSLTHDLQD